VKSVYTAVLNVARRLWHIGVIPFFLSLIFVQGLALMTQFAVARLLTVEEFGVVRVVEAFLSIGLVPAGLGMTSVVVKTIAEAQDDQTRGRILFHALLLTGGFSIVVCLGLQAAIPLLDFSPLVTTYLSFTVLAFVPMNLSRVIISYFQGLKQIQRVVGINILFSFIAFVLVIVGMFIGRLEGWAWGRLLGQVLFVGGIAGFMRGVIQVRFDPQLLRSLARLGGMVAIAFLVDSIATSADVLYLEHLLNDSRQIGYYGLASIVISGCLLIASAVSAVAFPYFSERSAAPHQLLIVGRRALLRLFAIMLPITLGVYLFAPLVTLFLGEGYATSVELLQIMCWGLLPAAGVLLLLTWLFAIGRPDGSVVVSLCTIALNVALIRWLVPLTGINGAAAAYLVTIFTRFTLCVLILAWIYRRMLFPVRKSDGND
jgi:O-antigen/teichoic acid export membrane protein